MRPAKRLNISFQRLQQALIKHGGSRSKTAREFGVSPDNVRLLIRAGKANGYRFQPAPVVCRADPYIPTPAEIRAACLAFQATWSETERRNRLGLLAREDVAYTIPINMRYAPLDGRIRRNRR